jgi:hypothetical protein
MVKKDHPPCQKAGRWSDLKTTCRKCLAGNKRRFQYIRRFFKKDVWVSGENAPELLKAEPCRKKYAAARLPEEPGVHSRAIFDR